MSKKRKSMELSLPVIPTLSNQNFHKIDYCSLQKNININIQKNEEKQIQLNKSISIMENIFFRLTHLEQLTFVNDLFELKDIKDNSVVVEIVKISNKIHTKPQNLFLGLYNLFLKNNECVFFNNNKESKMYKIEKELIDTLNRSDQLLHILLAQSSINKINNQTNIRLLCDHKKKLKLKKKLLNYVLPYQYAIEKHTKLEENIVFIVIHYAFS
jgi:hypothetical protein